MLAVGEDAGADALAVIRGEREVVVDLFTYSGSGLKPACMLLTLRLTSTNVSSAVRSTARRVESEGGFSSTISPDLASCVSMRKSRMALVILASGSPLSCRCRMAAASCLNLGLLMSGGMLRSHDCERNGVAVLYQGSDCGVHRRAEDGDFEFFTALRSE